MVVPIHHSCIGTTIFDSLVDVSSSSQRIRPQQREVRWWAPGSSSNGQKSWAPPDQVVPNRLIPMRLSVRTIPVRSCATLTFSSARERGRGARKTIGVWLNPLWPAIHLARCDRPPYGRSHRRQRSRNERCPNLWNEKLDDCILCLLRGRRSENSLSHLPTLLERVIPQGKAHGRNRTNRHG